MLNRADAVAARDNYHGHVTSRRISEAVGQLVNKTLPGALLSRQEISFRKSDPLPARWFHS